MHVMYIYTFEFIQKFQSENGRRLRGGVLCSLSLEEYEDKLNCLIKDIEETEQRAAEW